MHRVNFQLLQNIATSLGLMAYHGNGNQNEGHEYPNLTILIKADSTGYYCYLNPGVAEREQVTAMVADLERAFDAYGVNYRATGLVHVAGMKSYEYDIEV